MSGWEPDLYSIEQYEEIAKTLTGPNLRTISEGFRQLQRHLMECRSDLETAETFLADIFKLTIDNAKIKKRS